MTDLSNNALTPGLISAMLNSILFFFHFLVNQQISIQFIQSGKFVIHMPLSQPEVDILANHLTGDDKLAGPNVILRFEYDRSGIRTFLATNGQIDKVQGDMTKPWVIKELDQKGAVAILDNILYGIVPTDKLRVINHLFGK